MLSKIKDLALKAYASPTGYRLFWTGVQVGVGAVAGVLADDPRVGALVTTLAVIVTSVAREKLAARKAEA